MARRSAGLGLGLAIAKALVELHGGTIAAHSDGPDTGATFTVTLPAAVPRGDSAALAPLESSESEQPASGGGARKLRMLLIEDHTDTAAMLSRYLETKGFCVRHAATARAALDLAAAEPFDVILSDIGLPDATGCHSYHPSAGTRQRRRWKGPRKAGAVATLSTRALNVV